MELKVDTRLSDIIYKHKEYFICDEYGRGVEEEDIDYLIRQAKTLQMIGNAFYSVECYRMKEARNSFHNIVGTILEEASE